MERARGTQEAMAPIPSRAFSHAWPERMLVNYRVFLLCQRLPLVLLLTATTSLRRLSNLDIWGYCIAYHGHVHIVDKIDQLFRSRWAIVATSFLLQWFV